MNDSINTTASVNVHQDDTANRLRSGTQNVLWVLAAQFAVSVAIGAYGYSAYGTQGIATTAIAALICFIPASLALYAVAMTAGTPNALSGTLVSMVVRSAVPIFVTILLVQTVKPLADTGLFAMVLVNYLAVLAVESVLAVRMIKTLAPPAVQQ